MRKKLFFTTLFVSLSLVGCTNKEDLVQDQQDDINQLTEEVAELKSIITNQDTYINEMEEFTYLHEFSDEDLAAYDLFVEDYDVTHLSGYSPENIVLLYFHTIATSDIKATYAISYDGGTLPDFETFKARFYAQENSNVQHDAVIRYKHYDTVKVLDENKTEDKQIVEIKASMGVHGSANLYEVQNEDGQWKLAIQHWLEEI